MSQTHELRARIQTLDERLARLRAERDRLLARASQADRKRDTRRKILIGGAVLAAIGREGIPPLRSELELLRWMDTRLTRPHDRTIFGFAMQESGARRASDEPSAIGAPETRREAAVKEAGGEETAPPRGAKRP